MRIVGNEKSMLWVNSPDSFSWVLSTTLVRPVSIEPNTFWVDAVTMSQPRIKSAPDAAMRIDLMSFGEGAMRK